MVKNKLSFAKQRNCYGSCVEAKTTTLTPTSIALHTSATRVKLWNCITMGARKRAIGVRITTLQTLQQNLSQMKIRVWPG